MTHDLAWNGREWWVTTYNEEGEAISGEPLRMFLDAHPEGYVA